MCLRPAAEIGRVSDAIYDDPRLAEVYDPLDPDRSDLDVYAALVDEFNARRVLDIGCGTGTFAVLLAARGIDVVGLEPAAASLAVARRKPDAQRVRWVHGTARDLPPLSVDLATMTANVARQALATAGRLVFETRIPVRRAWEQWTREHTHDVTDIPGIGRVESWREMLDVDLPLVTFRGTYVFASDGAVVTSDSTLRFRERDEVEADLTRHGYVVDEVRDAPDRPGREWVFVARRQ
jgi:SAM-dependent methyltransferase